MWILLGLLLGLAGIALWIRDRGATAPITELPGPDLGGDPDVYMQGALVSQFRQDGTLEYRLAADQIRHFQTDAVTRLKDPVLTLFDRSGAPWQVSARTGVLERPAAAATAPAAEERVVLRDDVTLEQTRPDGELVRLVTASLTLYPGRQYAETDQDVMIENQVGRTTARGLQGDLQLGLLKLFSTGGSKVHTTLQPNEFK